MTRTAVPRRTGVSASGLSAAQISGVLPPKRPAAASIFATLFCWQTLLILLVLLFPTAYFHQYFIALTVAILCCCWTTKPCHNPTSSLFIGFGFFLLGTSIIRSLTYTSAGVVMNDNLRDYFEIVRIFPLTIMFVLRDRWRSLLPEHFLWAIVIFLSLDGVVTLLQTTHTDFYGIQEIVSTYYNSEHHRATSLDKDGRALGLSGGPGQHATVLAISAVIMLNGAFVFLRFWIIGLAGAGLAAVLLVCSQSQTGLIVVSAAVCGLLAIQILHGTAQQRTLAITITAVLGFSVTSLIAIITQFSYLNSLFTHGLNRNSYLVRHETRQYVLGLMAETPQWYLIGHGKEYFGAQSTTMDNEYLYALAVYGAPIAIFLVCSALLLLIRLALFTPQITTNYWDVTLLGLLALGLGFAWPISFFTEPRSMAMFCLVMAAQQAHRSAPVPAGPLRRPSPMAPRPIRAIPHQAARTPSLSRR